MIKNILKIAGLVLLVTLFFGCEEDSSEEMSVTERIAAFENSLNEGDYDNLNQHFHPSMESYFTYLDTTVTASSAIGSNHYNFDFTTPTVTDNGDNKNAAGLFSSDSATNWAYTAEMKEDGDNNWKIYSLEIDSGADVFTLAGVSR